jgi:hypothetical protein
MDCPRVRYPQFNDTVEGDLAEHGYKVMADPSEQVDKVGGVTGGGGYRSACLARERMPRYVCWPFQAVGCWLKCSSSHCTKAMGIHNLFF